MLSFVLLAAESCECPLLLLLSAPGLHGAFLFTGGPLQTLLSVSIGHILLPFGALSNRHRDSMLWFQLLVRSALLFLGVAWRLLVHVCLLGCIKFPFGKMWIFSISATVALELRVPLPGHCSTAADVAVVGLLVPFVLLLR